MQLRLLALASAMGVVWSVPSARAQNAWVGGENTLSMGLSYTYGVSSEIVETDGRVLKNQPVKNHAMLVSVEYVTPLPDLAIEASLPFAVIQWTPETSEGTAHGPWDDGSLHFAPTDIRLGGRYMLVSDPAAISIGLAGTIPTNNYPVQGFAAPGRGLRAGHANVAVGATADPVLPRLYAHASYEFSLVQRFNNDMFPELQSFNQNRSDVAFRIGYFVTEDLEINAAIDIRIAHGGFNFVDWGSPATTEATRNFHDALLDEDAFWAGGGISYQITETISAIASVRIFADGTNTRNVSLFSTGLDWAIF